jgi:drug/metabolite transporter (DMT)-like permease
MSGFRLTRTDGLLVLMTVIWGANYSIVKVALDDIPPLAFNSLRLGLASLLFLLTLAIRRRPARRSICGTGEAPVGSTVMPDIAEAQALPPVFGRSHIPGRDWVLIAVFGLIGHFVYQVCFMIGLDKTTAANSSLILGCSPVVVALFSAALGHERVRAAHWAGAALSVVGIYLVVGRGAHIGGASLVGDLLTICGLFCWGAYTVGAKGLLERHSPLEVTGYSMALGTVPFVLIGLGELRRLDWSAVPAGAWSALVFSAIFALFVAYLIWYVAVQRIGNLRTAMYSNVTPIAALAFAVLWLGEYLHTEEIVGAIAILTGMALTRLTSASRVRSAAPAEE